MLRVLIAFLVTLGLTVAGPISSASAAKPIHPDIQIVYEYSTPTEPPVPGTFAVVNYTADDYWLCLKWIENGTNYQYSFFLDEYAEPGHERTGLVNVDAGTTINLYLATFTPDDGPGSVACTKQRIDTFRVPR